MNKDLLYSEEEQKKIIAKMEDPSNKTGLPPASLIINRHDWSSDKYDSIITGIYSAVGGKNPIGLFGRSFSFGTDMSKRGEI